MSVKVEEKAVDPRQIDLFKPGRGRGRPPGVSSLSPAQRQAARRARLAAAGVESLTVHLPVELLDALAKFVQFKDETKSDAVARILRDRLLRKR